MAKKSNAIKVEFKISVILILLSALSLFLLIMLQTSYWFEKKLFYNFYGQIWATTWIMSLILLLTISSLVFKIRFLKIILGLIIILAIITSTVGLFYSSTAIINRGTVSWFKSTNTIIRDLKFSWDNNFLPVLASYITGFIGCVLWMCKL